MPQAARAPVSVKAAPARERPGNVAAVPAKRTAAPPPGQRATARSAPCACGGHCPRCQRPATAAPKAKAIPAAPKRTAPPATKVPAKTAPVLAGALEAGGAVRLGAAGI